MRVEAYEKAFLGLGGALLLVCLAALAYASLAMGIHLPTKEGLIDPQTVEATPPFDAPGVRRIGPDRYEAVVIGRAWQFIPREIRVPAGAEVTFIATSPDVLHGFHIEKTLVNVMLIPGQISRVSHRFEEPGEYLLLCHEYCGMLHHTMYGKVIVE